MASITDHVIQHEGIPPIKSTKYILRTDIIHERDIDVKNVSYKFKKNETLSKWTKYFEPSCFNYTEWIFRFDIIGNFLKYLLLKTYFLMHKVNQN